MAKKNGMTATEVLELQDAEWAETQRKAARKAAREGLGVDLLVLMRADAQLHVRPPLEVPRSLQRKLKV